MKKIYIWSIIVLCIFCYTQIFAFSGDILPEDTQTFGDENETFLGEEGVGEQEIIEENLLKEPAEESIELVDSVEEDIETGTGTGGEGENNSGTLLDIPELDFQIGFQNPTYFLEKEIQKTEYLCDKSREECKLNIIFQDIYGEKLGSKYICSYFQNGEEYISCNPTTIIMNQTSEILYQVYHKDNSENIVQKSILYIVLSQEEEAEDENTNTEANGNTVDNGESEETQETQEETNSGSVIDGEESTYNSGSVTIDNDIITGSGSDIGEENTSTGMIIPEIILEIQSGLNYSGTGNVYECKTDICRTNLDITESFSGSFQVSDYDCEWNFGSGSFTTENTDKKCNPGYVTFPGGTHSIQSKIILKENSDMFSEYVFTINNNFSEQTEETIETGSGDTNTGTIIEQDEIIFGTGTILPDNTETGSGEITGTGGTISGTGVIYTGSGEILFLFPEINIEIQSGAERLSENTFTCTKNDCKINLDTTAIFTEEFKKNNYECKWDFLGGSFSNTGTIFKCNPGYIDYEIGEYDITYFLYEKNNRENFIQKNIILKNEKIIPVSKSKSSGSSGSSSKNYTSKIDYDKISSNKEIIIQSGLTNNSCESETCKINLNYENSTYESCNWNFGIPNVVEKYATTCNPGFLYYPSGKYEIQLTVLSEKTGKKYDKFLTIDNKFIKEDIQIHQEENNENGEIEREEGGDNILLSDEDIIIELQGKKTDYKKYIGDKILCFGVDRCNINLNLIQESKNKFSYIWDLGNGNISEKKNPKSYWYETGIYNITLEIIGESRIYNKTLTIEVLGKELQKEDEVKLLEIEKFEQKQNSFFTNIFSRDKMSTNPVKNIKENFSRDNIDSIIVTKFSDSQKYIKNIGWLKNSSQKNTKLKLTRNINKQKKSLKFSGITYPNATIFILFGDEILEIAADKKGKYVFHTTDISSGIYDLEYIILDQNGDMFESTRSKELILESDYISTVKSYQKTQLSNSGNKKVSQNKIKNSSSKTIQEKTKVNTIGGENTSEYEEIIHITTFNERIFHIFLIIISILGGGVILRRYKII